MWCPKMPRQTWKVASSRNSARKCSYSVHFAHQIEHPTSRTLEHTIADDHSLSWQNTPNVCILWTVDGVYFWWQSFRWAPLWKSWPSPSNLYVSLSLLNKTYALNSMVGFDGHLSFIYGRCAFPKSCRLWRSILMSFRSLGSLNTQEIPQAADKRNLSSKTLTLPIRASFPQASGFWRNGWQLCHQTKPHW